MSIAATLLAALVNLSVAQHNPDTRHYFANKHESTFEKKYKIDIYGAFSKKELDELGAYVEKARNKVPALETGFVLAK
ncbi:MAG: hypothetical protein ABIN58_10545, partial [candidate division WOR-3 bacterium]